jgi:hypothetical protein
VAKLRKDQDLLSQNGESVEAAYCGTVPAEDTAGLIDCGHGDRHRLPLPDIRLQEKVCVGSFHVTIQE